MVREPRRRDEENGKRNRGGEEDLRYGIKRTTNFTLAPSSLFAHLAPFVVSFIQVVS
jgi:hypothetical protein